MRLVSFSAAKLAGNREAGPICPIGYFHIDIAEVQTAEGKLRLFVAIDWTNKFAPSA